MKGYRNGYFIILLTVLTITMEMLRTSNGVGLSAANATITVPFNKGMMTTTNSNDHTASDSPIQSVQIFKESHLAHHLLDGLNGIEIGASVHNPFGLRTLNVDYTSAETVFTDEQRKLAGQVAKVDIEARADRLPLKNGSKDFVINSHVLEHLYDQVSTVEEWMRVLKPRSLIYIIVPHIERTFDRGTRESTVEELLQRHRANGPPKGLKNEFAHFSFWTLRSFLKLSLVRNWHIVALQNIDDKVGNGFTVVLKKE